MLPRLRAGDIVITLGAGTITHPGPELLSALATHGLTDAS
jgi:UDP-N-acetylmuramate--alanine ligase